MKRLFTLALGVIAVSVLSGCVSQNASKVSGPLSANTKTVVATPAVKVIGPVSGTASANILFVFTWGPSAYADGITFNSEENLTTSSNPMAGMFGGIANALDLTGKAIDKVKSAAAYNALQNTKGDILLSPNYVINVEDYVVFKKVKCTASGIAAKVTGISKLEYKDYVEMSLIGKE